jgi:hypothetical protein
VEEQFTSSFNWHIPVILESGPAVKMTVTDRTPTKTTERVGG